MLAENRDSHQSGDNLDLIEVEADESDQSSLESTGDLEWDNSSDIKTPPKDEAQVELSELVEESFTDAVDVILDERQCREHFPYKTWSVSVNRLDLNEGNFRDLHTRRHESQLEPILEIDKSS